MTTSNSKASTPKTQKELLIALGLTRSKAVKKYGTKNLTYELRKEWEQREIETCKSAEEIIEVLASPLVEAVEMAISECSSECSSESSNCEPSEQQPIDFDGLAQVLSEYALNLPSLPNIDLWSDEPEQPEQLESDEPYNFARTYKYKVPPVSVPLVPIAVEVVEPELNPVIANPVIATVSTTNPHDPVQEESWGDLLCGIAYHTAELMIYTARNKVVEEVSKAVNKTARKATGNKLSIRFKLF